MMQASWGIYSLYCYTFRTTLGKRGDENGEGGGIVNKSSLMSSRRVGAADTLSVRPLTQSRRLRGL